MEESFFFPTQPKNPILNAFVTILIDSFFFIYSFFNSSFTIRYRLIHHFCTAAIPAESSAISWVIFP